MCTNAKLQEVTRKLRGLFDDVACRDADPSWLGEPIGTNLRFGENRRRARDRLVIRHNHIIIGATFVFLREALSRHPVDESVQVIRDEINDGAQGVVFLETNDDDQLARLSNEQRERLIDHEIARGKSQ